jgi:frataxin-like iron-binding protein CyaY
MKRTHTPESVKRNLPEKTLRPGPLSETARSANLESQGSPWRAADPSSSRREEGANSFIRTFPTASRPAAYDSVTRQMWGILRRASFSTGAGTRRSLPPHLRELAREEMRAQDAMVPPQEKMEELASAELTRVELAMKRMQEANANLSVERWDRGLDIDLGTKLGVYQVRYLAETKCLQLESPKSGSYFYHYDPPTDKWIAVKDGHDFEGMLTRDIIQQANGYPDF